MKKDSYEDLKSLLNNSVDYVFNLIHGEGGEDGKIQGYLDNLEINYSDLIHNHLEYHLINIKLKDMES